MPKLLTTLTLPSGLRGLSESELVQIAQELREELIDSVSSSGGHFASSLGATEITVALHHKFNTPEDRIVWDVGHQAYIHKMLTGRLSKMPTIRRAGGLSGFLKRSESEYDCFGAGHAGTSLSAAVGMRMALPENRYVVTVIGDGSITAGMAFEAMNHAGSLGLKKFIVILNDNEMSISANVGYLSWLFSMAVTSRASNFARSNFKYLYQKGFVPEIVYKAIDRAEEAAQGFFASASMLFESFGFRYIGPVDGHNLSALCEALENAKQQDVPVVIHASTVKGRGYEPAEEDPITWHGVVPFDRNNGQFHGSTSKKPATYTSVFASSLIELAKKDSRILAITAAMPGGTGLDKFQAALPAQFYDVGICEQHAVTFAAGLACEGKKPVCAIYSTFLQRAYDQVVHDVCIQNLPVVFCMDRAGVVGNDGETHQGAFDTAYLRTLPNMVLMSPKDELELQRMLTTALQHEGPVAIRYPRGNGVGVALENDPQILPIGKAEVLRRGDAALLIAFGPHASTCASIGEMLSKEGIEITVINARFAKPLDSALFEAELPRYPLVLCVEDHALIGGFSSALLELINDRQIQLSRELIRLGLHDQFVAHGSQEEQYRLHGYDKESIIAIIRTHCHTHRHTHSATPALAAVG